mmetsp:Transcript_27685/g.75466  ORF Transcript_27685/g.75466 Transcript_27685/m.75466 type:complete len:608 (+) Transcript_27685:217-2040(+)
MKLGFVGLWWGIFGVLFRCSIDSLAPVSLLVGALLLFPMDPVDGFLQVPKPAARAAHVVSTVPSAKNRVTESSFTTSPEENGVDDTERSGNKAVSSERRSLRRQIPYVEAFDEQIVRELWEADPFDGNEFVVQSVIAASGTNGDCGPRSAILTPVDTQSSFVEMESDQECDGTTVLHSTSLSGYEDSFDPIYKPMPSNTESDPIGFSIRDSTNTGTTTASVAASEFAWIPPKNPNESEKMQNFFLRVAYNGNAFCGWQTQLKNFDQPSVQRTLEEWLTELQNNDQTTQTLAAALANAEKHAERKRERRLRKQEKLEAKQKGTGNPAGAADNKHKDERREKASTSTRIKWADLPVAGRTDRGVSAIGQVCRFRTHRKDLTVTAIHDYLADRIRTTPRVTDSLGITEIAKVSRSFHPTFSTCSRAYVYLIDVAAERESGSESERNERMTGFWNPNRVEQQVALLDGMLQQLEGKALDYVGVSYGKVKTLDTICILHHARAKLVQYEPSSSSSLSSEENQPANRTAVCIELVGDRFLRRMVRLLVEASLRLLALAEQKTSGASETVESEASRDALLELIEKRNRTIVGRPAPPDGLIFVGARLPSAQQTQ